MAAAGEDVLMRVVGALVLVLVLAGCGSASGSSLEDAADATAAETSRFELSYLVAEKERKHELTATGLFDYPNERGLMTISGMPVWGPDVRFEEFRLIGSTGYGRFVVEGKPYWVKEEVDNTISDPTDLLIPLPGGPTKPTDVLTRFLLASEENEVIGKDDVRGTEATHYRARVDVEKLMKQLAPAERPEDSETTWGTRFAPVEIWIDDESRLRRLEITQPESDEGDAQTIMTAELYDYGVDVDVQPPEGETISQEKFDKLTSRLEGGLIPGSGEGKPLGPPREVCAWARDELPKKEADEFCAAAEAAEGEEK